MYIEIVTAMSLYYVISKKQFRCIPYKRKNQQSSRSTVSTIGITIYPTKKIKRCIHNTVLEIHRYPLWTVFHITGTCIHWHYTN